MRTSKIVMLTMILLALLCFSVTSVIAEEGPNSTGNPAHGDDWGGACPGNGNWGSGNPGQDGPLSVQPPVILVSYVW